VLGRNGASLLRVNKLIYGEALPVLYGANRFRFDGLPSFIQFMMEKRPGLPLLRDVGAVYWTKGTMQKVTELFTDISRLECFRIPVRGLHAESLVEIVDRLERGLTTFVCQSNAEIDRRRRRFNIIHMKDVEQSTDVSVERRQGPAIMTVAEALAALKWELEERLIRSCILTPLRHAMYDVN